ncbi:Os01g0900800 [Oryza sativa Japonica Group]|uniref:Os01g0900800 protein n=1 Tax=Oryza sativa subsp. japonica TaxID=39947 RepID=A0A0P0VBP9_ORYSJ|nr:Os01g0900800 [Oryza sativa Japonica Group]
MNCRQWHGRDERDGRLLRRRRRRRRDGAQEAELAVELLAAGPAADIGDGRPHPRHRGEHRHRRRRQQLQRWRRPRRAVLLLPLLQELLHELLGRHQLHHVLAPEQLQPDSVACRARAKRGCATHPRSIAERVSHNLAIFPSPIFAYDMIMIRSMLDAGMEISCFLCAVLGEENED